VGGLGGKLAMWVVTHDACTTPNCIEYVKVRCEVRQYGAWVTEEMRPVGKASRVEV